MARRRWRTRALAAAAAVACLVGAAAGELGRPEPSLSLPTQAMAHAGRAFPRPARVAVMVLENRSFGQVIRSRSAPYLSGLAQRSALATRYYALTHPSLPNYLALTTGSTADITSNCSRCSADGISLVNQLDARHISWRAYFESIGRHPAAAVSAGRPYNKHYNPFVYTDDVSDNPLDRARVVGFAALYRDLAHRTLPRFSWIAPNVHHDGHHHPLRAADAFARRLVPRVVRALGPDGVLYLTWDEGVRRDARGVDGSQGGGHVALIAAGGMARRHGRVAVPATHYALLRTIEANFGLAALGHAADASTPLLGGLLKRVPRRPAVRPSARRVSAG